MDEVTVDFLQEKCYWQHGLERSDIKSVVTNPRASANSCGQLAPAQCARFMSSNRAVAVGILPRDCAKPCT